MCARLNYVQNEFWIFLIFKINRIIQLISGKTLEYLATIRP